MNTKQVYHIFNRIKELASFTLKLGLKKSCISYVKAAGWWAYNFNLCFRDDTLEMIIYKLSQKIERTSSFISDDECVAFVDNFAYDRHGLTQQYVRAIMSQQRRLLYITDASSTSPASQGIYKELKKYKLATIVNIPNIKWLSGLERAQYIYQQLISARPSKVFMHLAPNAAEVLIAVQALPDCITKYQINLTDHTFWLGARVLDYSFEFRAFGVEISKKERKIANSRLLLCPYYPIIENIPYLGFPFEKGNHCVFFSGGSTYKFVDKKYTFFSIMKRILDENPNLIWVHAGDDMEGIKEMILTKMSEQYLSRIFLIGRRDDIGEVFNHIDVYVNSYPLGGGLMNLYAAHYAKPILSLLGETFSAVDDIVGQLKPVTVDQLTTEDFCQEASRLIEDEGYRLQKGKHLQESIIDEEQFNALFDDLCNTHENRLQLHSSNRKIQLPSMEGKCILESQYAGCRSAIMRYLKWRGLLIPYCKRQALNYYPSKVKSVLYRYFKK